VDAVLCGFRLVANRGHGAKVIGHFVEHEPSPGIAAFETAADLTGIDRRFRRLDQEPLADVE
jgi:hypothetical protein